MIGVFYPYRADDCVRTKNLSPLQPSELKLSMESVKKYFKEDFEFWIVGDCPQWAKEMENVKFIQHQRNELVHEPALFDATEKLKLYIEHPETPEVFVRMYDDVYLLAPRKLEDLKVTRYLFEYDELADRLRSGGAIWRNQVMRSVEAVRKLGYPGRMTETHCPEVFEKERMQTIFSHFKPGVNRLVTSTLYYNVFPWEREIRDWKTERALFHGYENEFSYGHGNIDKKVKGKFYLNHNDMGLDEELWNWICKRMCT
jgi:hypothetical protein